MAALSLFPAMCRAWLVVRRLFVETGELTFVILAVPVVHIPLSVADFAFLVQATPHVLLSAGLLCTALMSTPYAVHPSPILRALSVQEFDAAVKVRRRISVFLAVAGHALLVVFVLMNAMSEEMILCHIPRVRGTVQLAFAFLQGMCIASVFFGNAVFE